MKFDASLAVLRRSVLYVRRMSEQPDETNDLVNSLLRQAAEARVIAATAMIRALTMGDPEIWEPTPEKIAEYKAELAEAEAELADLNNADRT
ncbi:hypothetical protein [Mesorhizobium sp.]|uniref:hypothetical protein n=1 Tax=Mesorhizobium sp. TaxID=1871066 RepID=UPI0025F1ECDA|nr:hypothetical protein [Mesorhizobium sp.]